MKVQTSRGLIERDRLRIEEVTEWHDNARVTVTYWYLDDEEVRKDVHAAMLRGLESELSNGQDHSGD
jgi:hypothetical protein